MYREVIDELGIIVAILDKETFAPKLASAKFAQLVGRQAEEIIRFFESKNNDFTKQKLADFAAESPYKFVIPLRDGRIRMSVEFALTRHDSGDLMIVGNDITEQKKLEYSLKSYSAIMEKQDKLLYEMAYTDALTGVHNRRAIFEKFTEYANNSTNTLGSICILDIDHFKQFNDRYGHKFGDHVLKYFSEQVNLALDDDCFFARIGGEEFCTFSYSRSGSDLNAVIDDILDSIKDGDIVTPEQRVTNISFSAGIAEYTKDGTTLDELLNNADKALYFAKAAGRARVISFSTDIFEKRDDTLIPNYRETDR